MSSDEEEVLAISEEEVEFLDHGAVQKPKKPSRLRKVQTPCYIYCVEHQSFVWRNWEKSAQLA